MRWCSIFHCSHIVLCALVCTHTIPNTPSAAFLSPSPLLFLQNVLLIPDVPLTPSTLPLSKCTSGQSMENGFSPPRPF
ncbi:hypothetical protein BDD12DRAFT_870840, partial [Trichophaea hybrida]